LQLAHLFVKFPAVLGDSELFGSFLQTKLSLAICLRPDLLLAYYRRKVE